VAVAVDLAAPLLLAVGVVDGSVDGEDGATEVLGVGVPDDVTAEGVGLGVVDPVGVADDELDGCVLTLCLGDEWLLSVSPRLVPEPGRPWSAELTGLPIISSNTVMPATTTRKNPAATPP
jgi:hypothetical protein